MALTRWILMYLLPKMHAKRKGGSKHQVNGQYLHDADEPVATTSHWLPP
jgi:hypothetical protein